MSKERNGSLSAPERGGSLFLDLYTTMWYKQISVSIWVLGGALEPQPVQQFAPKARKNAETDGRTPGSIPQGGSEF